MESERSGSSSSSSGSGSESGSESGDCSSSGSGSGSSSGNSSEAEEERLEPVTILGNSLSLPQLFCESRAIFDEVLSARTWDSLEDSDRERLRAFLPTFEEDDTEEKERTVRALFARETFHFSSPLETFHTNLRQGNFRPDIAKMKRYLIKARHRQQKQKMRSYYAALLPDVLLARERLLAAAKSSPPGPPPRLLPLPQRRPRKQYKPAHARAKLRYFEELAAIRSEVGEEHISDDENYPEGPPQTSRRQRRHMTAVINAANMGVASTLGGVESSRPSSLDCLKRVLAAHRARRQRREHHPELITTGITIEDIKQRVALVNGTKKITVGASKSEPRDKTNKNKRTRKDIKKPPVPIDVKPFKLLGDDYNKVVIKNERVDSDSDNSYIDPVESPKANKRFKFSSIKSDIKQEFDTKYGVKVGSSSNTDIKLDVKIKQEVEPIPFPTPHISQPVPIKLEDLEGIDMMDLPVELVDCEVTEPLKSERPETTHDPALMETTHANFLSLVRALFPARTAHRAARQELRSRCAALMSSPIAPLNTWYNLSDDWCTELDSALEFLAGEKGPHPDDFVPYLTYIADSQMYQWIGAGRDCDAILGRLCERWLRSKTAACPPPPAPPSPRLPAVKVAEPHPSRSSTTWSVRPPTAVELADFHQQERRRYSSAAKPFTYVQHGYRSVVGPAGRGPANRASHAALLVADRPRHVSFAALVKDAVARLPNGEGTRAQVLTLLKMSQYLAPCGEGTLAGAVSGALDRLHTVKRDPFLRYDQRSKLWIYLHRHKSEEDWERTARSRNSKATSRASKESASVGVPPPPLTPTTATPLSKPMELDVCKVEQPMVSESDSDVDVDDSGPAAACPPPLARPPPVQQRPQLVQARPVTPQHKLMQQVRPQQASRLKQQIQKQQKVLQHQKILQTPSKPAAKCEPALPKQPVKTQPKVSPVKHASSPPSQLAQAIVTPVVATPKPSMQTVVPPKSSPMVQVTLPQKSPAPKQRILMTTTAEHTVQTVQTPPPPPSAPASSPLVPQSVASVCAVTAAAAVTPAGISLVSTVPVPSATVAAPKVTQATRSLLLKASTPTTSLPGVATATSVLTPTIVTNAQVNVGGRRGVVRVLSPATPTSGKSLISPRALMPQAGSTMAAKRRPPAIQTSSIVTTSVQTPTVTTATATSVALATRTVQLAGGRTVQLATNQTLHLTQTIQCAGQTLQLSSLGMGARLPTSQTIQPTSQVARPSTVVRPALANNAAKGTIQLSSQSLPVSLASQMQLGQSVRLASGQTVTLGGQSVTLGGQSVTLGGQTVQLAGGQTVQLTSGQTIQLANGQTVQLGATVGAPRSIVTSQQSVRPATPDKAAQPLVAKLLTNSQGQVISVESVMGAGRTLQLANLRPQATKPLQTVQGMSGVRVVGVAANTRMTRPLLLTHKPLHNIILQQGETAAIRAATSTAAATGQAIVLSSIGGQATGSTATSASPPVLKLQQVSPMQQLKLSQGIKLQQGGGVVGGVRGVVMSTQQLKLVNNAGRHVLARVLRPAPPQ